MVAERLIHHSSERGYASYGRDGGQGRDIMIAPSGSARHDRRFIDQLNHPATTVSALVDNGPGQDVRGALDAIMPAWNTARRGNIFMVHTGQDGHTLLDGFMEAVRVTYARERLMFDEAQAAAMEVIREDVRESVDLAEGVLDTGAEMKFFSLYYPPASSPFSLTHNWHTDIFPQNVVGKMRLQRSLNVGGLCFAFKEQASPDIMEGVGLGTGRVAFKITDDNVHRGVQASAAEGRLIYTITGEPIHRFL